MLTVLISLHLEIHALLDPLGVSQDQPDAEVGVGSQVSDGVLGGGAGGVVAHLLPHLVLGARPVPILCR